MVSDSLPAKLTYVAGSATANPAIVNLANFPDISNPFTLPGNSSVIITYRLRVTDTAANGDKLTNMAMISAPTFSQAIIDIVIATVGSSGETRQAIYLFTFHYQKSIMP